MKSKSILVSGPSITQKEIKYLARAAKDSWGVNYKKYVGLFENKFANLPDINEQIEFCKLVNKIFGYED